MSELNVATRDLDSAAEAARLDGATAIFVTVDGRAAGIIAIADPVKPSARNALQALRQDGLRIVMLTGDNPTTARTVAKTLGIDEVEAGVLPERKSEVVQRLRHEGRRVAMVGDGVNDAPALAAADVGIAMGGGTDVAIESAGVTLLTGDLMGLVRARRLSVATMRNIRQNLAFAFLYNAAGVPIAAGVRPRRGPRIRPGEPRRLQGPRRRARRQGARHQAACDPRLAGRRSRIEQAIEPERQQQPALTDAQVVALAQLGRQIEAHFGHPQEHRMVPVTTATSGSSRAGRSRRCSRSRGRRPREPRVRVSRSWADDDRGDEAPGGLGVAADGDGADARGRWQAVRRRHPTTGFADVSATSPGGLGERRSADRGRAADDPRTR